MTHITPPGPGPIGPGAQPGYGALAERLGIQVVDAGPDRVVATMPVEGNTQPYGLLHGGASVALAETVGSLAASIHAGPGRAAVGIEVNATHHRAVRSGVVTAVAKAVHLGGRTASYEIVLTEESGKRVCTARLTCLLLDSAPAASGSPSS
jgi:uncharacterized protein (TIGR00369 family)